MICFDVEFPEVARTLALRGADLLITISANPEVFRRDHEVFVPARALENGVPHLYVNRVGRQEDVSFGGTSMAIDPEGTVLSEAGPTGRGIAGRPDRRARTPGRAHALPRAAASIRVSAMSSSLRSQIVLLAQGLATATLIRLAIGGG